MKTFLTFFVLCAVPLFSQETSAQSEFEKFKKEQQAGIQAEADSFKQYKAEVTKEYDNWVAEQERLFKEYVSQIEKVWGTKNTKTSTQKEYVAYDNNFSSRKSVDFEKGNAKVEVVVTESEAKNLTAMQEKLKEQVAELVTTKGGTDPLEKKTGSEAEKQPILENQVTAKDGKPVTEKNAKQFAEQTVTPAQITQEQIIGKDGVKRVVIGVQFALVPNHLKKRAEEFRSKVLSETDKNNIDATLVFAVMHTESYFNPKARSTAPAFGLMQLVPKSGARDAYLFVHREDKLVTAEYLYIPENNIELGAGYLTKLLTIDFKGVKDPKSRIYCAISAYNTGPGNVAKAFTKDKRSVPQALPKINAMTSDEVLKYLKENLPFEETRKYVGTVSERMGLYNEWTKN
ncbi:MAG: DUF3393 domain-containing protein [Bacteroidetes bacterium]|nr:DUF3393 domain-containing protein [Bacteroidota bacterium]